MLFQKVCECRTQALFLFYTLSGTYTSFSRNILTTLNAGVINGTWNLTPLNAKSFTTRSKTPIPTQYTLHNCILESVSSAKYLGVDISSDLSWDTHINCSSKKANNTLGFLGETSRFTPNLLNLLLTKFLFVLIQSTVPQFGVHSQIQISLNLMLSNVERPDRSNMTMNRLPVSQK